MVKGKISLQVNRRLDTTSKKIKDKYRIEDQLELYCIKDILLRKRFKVLSTKLGRQPMKISRDELAFVRVVHYYYGNGDFCIKIWGKGKKRGLRPFWDGLIQDGKFIRRRNVAGFIKMSVSVFERESFADNSQPMIGLYMRTKRSGQWHNFM